MVGSDDSKTSLRLSDALVIDGFESYDNARRLHMCSFLFPNICNTSLKVINFPLTAEVVRSIWVLSMCGWFVVMGFGCKDELFLILGSLLAIISVVLAVMYAASWEQSAQNEWLLVLENDVLVGAGVGVRCFRGLNQTVVRFPDAIHKVAFRVLPTPAHMSQFVEISGHVTWRVSPLGEDPLLAYKFFQAGCSGEGPSMEETVAKEIEAIVSEQLKYCAKTGARLNDERLQEEVLEQGGKALAGSGVMLMNFTVMFVEENQGRSVLLQRQMVAMRQAHNRIQEEVQLLTEELQKSVLARDQLQEMWDRDRLKYQKQGGAADEHPPPPGPSPRSPSLSPSVGAPPPSSSSSHLRMDRRCLDSPPPHGGGLRKHLASSPQNARGLKLGFSGPSGRLLTTNLDSGTGAGAAAGAPGGGGAGMAGDWSSTTASTARSSSVGDPTSDSMGGMLSDDDESMEEHIQLMLRRVRRDGAVQLKNLLAGLELGQHQQRQDLKTRQEQEEQAELEAGGDRVALARLATSFKRQRRDLEVALLKETEMALQQHMLAQHDAEAEAVRVAAASARASSSLSLSMSLSRRSEAARKSEGRRGFSVGFADSPPAASASPEDSFASSPPERGRSRSRRSTAGQYRSRQMGGGGSSRRGMLASPGGGRHGWRSSQMCSSSPSVRKSGGVRRHPVSGGGGGDDGDKHLVLEVLDAAEALVGQRSARNSSLRTGMGSSSSKLGRSKKGGGGNFAEAAGLLAEAVKTTDNEVVTEAVMAAFGGGGYEEDDWEATRERAATSLSRRHAAERRAQTQKLKAEHERALAALDADAAP